jgi:hypothetical protein
LAESPVSRIDLSTCKELERTLEDEARGEVSAMRFEAIEDTIPAVVTSKNA